MLFNTLSARLARVEVERLVDTLGKVKAEVAVDRLADGLNLATHCPR